MKKTYFILFLILFTGSTAMAETWYTTGLSSEWNQAEAWSADPVLLDQRGIPAEGDDLVIRHPLTLSLSETYQHTGNISIQDEGILEVFTLEENTELILAGHQFLNEGIFMTNLPVVVRNQNQLTPSTFTHEDGSQVLLGHSLTLIGKVEVNFNNGNCGAVLVKGELFVTVSNITILGSGSWIVEGGYTIYNESGVALTDPQQRDQAFAEIMEKGLALYSDITMCAQEARGLAGTLDPAVDPQVEEEDSDNLISVFPNPSTSSNSMTIDAAGFEAEEQVFMDIRTLMGQQIMSRTFASTAEGSIHLTADWNLEPGQYIMTMRGASHLATQRLVRQ